MNTVFKDLRKKIAYGKVIRINQRIAVIKDEVEQLHDYLERIQGKGLDIAETSVKAAICKLTLDEHQLSRKRKDILNKYFNRVNLSNKIEWYNINNFDVPQLNNPNKKGERNG